MKKIEIAKMLGLKTRQQIDYVLAGQRNFSFETARKATLLIGGSLALWQDPERATERKDVFKQFLEKTKTAGEV
jgi:hypothetical protein